MWDMSTSQRSSAVHAKMSLFSCKKLMRLFSASLSSSEETMTCLSGFLSNSGTLLVSSASLALMSCSGSSCKGSLLFAFSLLRLCTFLYPSVTVLSTALALSWSPYIAMMPFVAGSFMQRYPEWRIVLKVFVTPRPKRAL